MFFELLWLDLFPAGTYIPPQRTLATFSTIVLSCEMQLESTATILPLMLIGLLLARLGAWLEARQRTWQNASYDRLYHRISEGQGELPLGRIVLGSMAQATALSAFLFGLVAVVSSLLHEAHFFRAFSFSSGIEWPHLWTLGLVGGLLALRIRKAYEMFIVGILICSILLFW